MFLKKYNSRNIYLLSGLMRKNEDEKNKANKERIVKRKVRNLET